MGWFSRKKNDVESDIVDVESDVEVSRTEGPFDEADHPERGELLDAGSLWIPQVPGAKLQFSMDSARKTILGIVYVKDGAALQLQAFAAPRSTGLWNDIRREMITSIAKQGGSSREENGPFGEELRANMPVPNTTTPQPHRFIGIDGPRWLLRATLYGKAGFDEAAANEMIEIVRKIVVVRGSAPHPPRELLPITLPMSGEKKDS